GDARGLGHARLAPAEARSFGGERVVEARGPCTHTMRTTAPSLQRWLVFPLPRVAGRCVVRLDADLRCLHGDPDATPLMEAELVRRLPCHFDGERERRAGEQPDA